jgi:hypothetical protein
MVHPFAISRLWSQSAPYSFRHLDHLPRRTEREGRIVPLCDVYFEQLAVCHGCWGFLEWAVDERYLAVVDVQISLTFDLGAMYSCPRAGDLMCGCREKDELIRTPQIYLDCHLILSALNIV